MPHPITFTDSLSAPVKRHWEMTQAGLWFPFPRKNLEKSTLPKPCNMKQSIVTSSSSIIGRARKCGVMSGESWLISCWLLLKIKAFVGVYKDSIH
jgi:hypothetical protein